MIRFPIPGRAKREALSTLVLPLLLSLSLAPAAFAQQQSPAKPGAKPAATTSSRSAAKPDAKTDAKPEAAKPAETKKK